MDGRPSFSPALRDEPFIGNADAIVMFASRGPKAISYMYCLM